VYESLSKRKSAKVASKMGIVQLAAVSQRILPEVGNEASCTSSFRRAHTHGGRNGRYIIHLPDSDQADKWFLVIPIQQAD
jgi:hypothetical protein